MGQNGQGVTVDSLLLDTSPVALSIADNGIDSLPELNLVGELPEGGRYSYTLPLVSGMTYNFQARNNISPDYVAVIDSTTHQLLWANLAASEILAAVGMASEGVINSFTDREVSLIFQDNPATEATEFDFDIYVTPTPTPVSEEVFRFARLTTGSYFYTSDINEKNFIVENLLDFRFEGSVFRVDNQVRDGWLPVHRFADTQTGAYFYTSNHAEFLSVSENPSFRDEGIAFYAPPSSEEGELPVYRMQNPRTHGYLFTTNPAEKAYALLDGWDDQGIAFYSASENENAGINTNPDVLI